MLTIDLTFQLRVKMKQDWIIDVLRDLRNFAMVNGMETLAAQIDETQLVAMVEIESKNEELLSDTTHTDSTLRSLLVEAGRCEH